MTKTQFIEKFWRNTDLKHRVQAERLVNTFLDTVKECVAEGENIVFVGFGTFEVKEKAQTVGRNPKTGEEVVIPAKKVVKFRAGKELKEIVNKR